MVGVEEDGGMEGRRDGGRGRGMEEGGVNGWWEGKRDGKGG